MFIHNEMKGSKDKEVKANFKSGKSADKKSKSPGKES
jgi:hypothetical protein